MPSMERVHECVTGVPAPEYFNDKEQSGWTLVGLEWERESAHAGPPGPLHDVPYGFRVAPDCRHLEVNDTEFRALTVIMEVIVADRPLSEAALELNRRGFRTRAERRWTSVDVFNLLPRIVEAGPSIFNSDQWLAFKARV